MPPFSRAPKYKAQPVTYAGERYDSKAEAAYAKWLDTVERAEQTVVLMRHPRFKLGCTENVYEADFLVIMDKVLHVIDVKGSETPKFKRDKKLWARYGKLPLRVAKLKLKYPPKGSAELPIIKAVDYEIVHGGLDRKIYGPLAPEWLRS